MANKNDERILKLKEQIEKKREELGKIARFTPATNLILELDGQRFNLNVLNKEQLTHMLVRLHSYYLSAGDLEIVDSYNISGYNIKDWVADVKAKLDTLSKKEKERELAVAEAQLSRLLSEEKQVELQLDGIESLLKGE